MAGSNLAAPDVSAAADPTSACADACTLSDHCFLFVLTADTR